MRDFSKTLSVSALHALCNLKPSEPGYDSMTAGDLRHAATLVGAASLQHHQPLEWGLVLLASIFSRVEKDRLTGIQCVNPDHRRSVQGWADRIRIERAARSIATALWYEESPAVLDDVMRGAMTRLLSCRDLCFEGVYDDTSDWSGIPDRRVAVAVSPAAVAQARVAAATRVLSFDAPLAVVRDPASNGADSGQGADEIVYRLMGECADAIDELKPAVDHLMSLSAERDDFPGGHASPSIADRWHAAGAKVQMAMARLREPMTELIARATRRGIPVDSCEKCMRDPESWAEVLRTCEAVINKVSVGLAAGRARRPAPLTIPSEPLVDVAPAAPALTAAAEPDEPEPAEAQPLEIDPTRFTVSMGEKKAVFAGRGKRTFALLERIARHPGQAVLFTTLRQTGDVWDGVDVADESIRSTVCRLREELVARGLKELADRICTGSYRNEPYVMYKA